MIRHLGDIGPATLAGSAGQFEREGRKGKGRTKLEFYAKFFKMFLKLLPSLSRAKPVFSTSKP